MYKDGKNALEEIMRKFLLSIEGEAFMAGILQNYQALLSFLTPSYNSLRRFKPQQNVGAY